MCSELYKVYVITRRQSYPAMMAIRLANSSAGPIVRKGGGVVLEQCAQVEHQPGVLLICAEGRNGYQNIGTLTRSTDDAQVAAELAHAFRHATKPPMAGLLGFFGRKTASLVMASHREVAPA